MSNFTKSREISKSLLKSSKSYGRRPLGEGPKKTPLTSGNVRMKSYQGRIANSISFRIGRLGVSFSSSSADFSSVNVVGSFL